MYPPFISFVYHTHNTKKQTIFIQSRPNISIKQPKYRWRGGGVKREKRIMVTIEIRNGVKTESKTLPIPFLPSNHIRNQGSVAVFI